MNFRDVLLGWIAHLSLLGAPTDSLLNDPVSEAEIAAAEAEIGFAFPSELRELYLIANGQRLPDSAEIPLLFGDYGFVRLEEALQEYRAWKSVYDDDRDDFADIYNWTTARAGDPVHPDYWRPGWFPIAVDWGGNAYAVDLSPPPGGTYGQIILIGRDEDERRVLAPSLGAFFARATEMRPPIAQRDGNMIIIDLQGRL